jgi:hypothetical protein
LLKVLQASFSLVVHSGIKVFEFASLCGITVFKPLFARGPSSSMQEACFIEVVVKFIERIKDSLGFLIAFRDEAVKARGISFRL